MTDNKTLRWGILGAARVNERLLPAIVEASHSRLVAIASRRPGAAAETLAKYAPCLSDVAVHDTLEGLLEDGNVQAVYLPMANHEHAEWALRAIRQGNCSIWLCGRGGKVPAQRGRICPDVCSSAADKRPGSICWLSGDAANTNYRKLVATDTQPAEIETDARVIVDGRLTPDRFRIHHSPSYQSDLWQIAGRF